MDIANLAHSWRIVCRPNRIRTAHVRYPHVEVDGESETVRLSNIYDWFSTDFVGQAQAMDLGDDALSWVIGFASDDLRPRLERAKQSGFAIEFVPYDWTLNGL